jgi:hypothetical protein
MMVVLFSERTSASVWRNRICMAIGWSLMVSAASRSLPAGRVRFPPDAPCGAFHLLRQLHVLDLDQRDFDAPRVGSLVHHLLQLLVDGDSLS